MVVAVELWSVIEKQLPSYPISARERRRYVRQKTGRTTDLNWLTTTDDSHLLSTDPARPSRRRGSQCCTAFHFSVFHPLLLLCWPGWYLRQKPVGGGSKAGGLPHPFLSPPVPFLFPLSFQTNQWEGRSDPVRGKFPGSPPPTNTTLVLTLSRLVAPRLFSVLVAR